MSAENFKSHVYEICAGFFAIFTNIFLDYTVCNREYQESLAIERRTKEKRKRERKCRSCVEVCVKGTLLIRAQRLPFDRREIITGVSYGGPLENVGKGE